MIRTLVAGMSLALAASAWPSEGRAEAAGRAVVEAMWEHYRTVPAEIEDIEILVLSAPKAEIEHPDEVRKVIDAGGPGVVHKRATRHTAYAPDRADRIVVRFSLPREDAGTSFLVHRAAGDGSDDQWLYLPATRRVRRVPVSSTQTFVGTNLIYEDVRGLSGERTDRFDYEVLDEATIDGRACHVIRARPRAGTESAYSARVLWIDKEKPFPLRVEYQNARGEPWKVLRNRHVQTLANGARRADLIEMRDLRINEATVLWIKERQALPGLPAHTFSRDALGK